MDLGKTSLLNNIASVISSSRHQVKQTVNHVMVKTYWEIGRLIVEDEQQGAYRAEYGSSLLEEISKELTEEFGKGFDLTNLYKMRAFYSAFPILDSVRLELSWTHYRALVRVKDKKAQEWYMQESVNENWSARALDRQISTQNYERILSSKDHDAVRNEAKSLTQSLADDAKNTIRDPYVLEFLNLPSQSILERDIEQALIDNLQKFILELGSGFAFVERQQRLSTQDQDFYIDLVFYNFKIKRFLLIDLKIGKLTHQDVGQMDTYVRMYDQLKIQADDNPTIGLILCSEKSEAVAKYSVLSDSEQLFASKYLPSIEALEKELARERSIIATELEHQKSSTKS